MLLSVRSLRKQYGSRTVFEDISFTVDDGHKIALVGKNGAGKSTLLRILAGVESPDSGSVTVAKGRVCAYAPQEVPQKDAQKTGDAYLREETGLKEHRFIPVLDGLGVAHDAVNGKIGDMSGGQQAKTLLAAFLLRPADLLLMDEPTNNLDIPSLVWLETFLASLKKSMIIVSHDLVFLNNVTNRVFEMKDGGLASERGTYGDYLERKKREHNRQMRQYREYEEKRRQLEKDHADLRQKGERIDAVQASDRDKFAAGVNRDRASGGQRRVRSLERQIRRLGDVEKPYEEDAFAIDLRARETDGDIEVSAEEVTFGYPGGLSVGPVSLTVKEGDRLCFMGANGAGKSTLLKTMTGDLPPISGSVSRTDGVRIGDFMQQHERADRGAEAAAFFRDQTGCDSERATHALKKIGFSDHMLHRTVGGLSPGMRARLLLAVFADLGVNMLVLDEPTNHLDAEAVFAVRDLLKTYQGIVLLVSHNRWFLKNIRIDRHFDIGDGGVRRIDDFDDYLQQAGERASRMTARLRRVVH